MMNQKLALGIAAALTAFVLALIGGLTAYLTGPQQAGANAAFSAASTQAAPALAAPTQDIQAIIDQHDSAYRQQLDEANRRLAEANARLQQVYAQQTQQAGTPAPQAQPTDTPQAEQQAQEQQASVTDSYPVSAQMAAAVALSFAPGSTLSKAPGLVSFQGTPAYEVLLDQGVVYVDATSGQVLYNAVTAPSNVAPSGRERGGDDGGEGGGDD